VLRAPGSRLLRGAGCLERQAHLRGHDDVCDRPQSGEQLRRVAKCAEADLGREQRDDQDRPLPWYVHLIWIAVEVRLGDGVLEVVRLAPELEEQVVPAARIEEFLLGPVSVVEVRNPLRLPDQGESERPRWDRSFLLTMPEDSLNS
jgi:hypothetical protein